MDARKNSMALANLVRESLFAQEEKLKEKCAWVPDPTRELVASLDKMGLVWYRIREIVYLATRGTDAAHAIEDAKRTLTIWEKTLDVAEFFGNV